MFPFVTASSDGIDDQDGLPNDWFVPANPGAVAPNNANMPVPAAAPNQPAPNPQPSTVPPGLSNPPAPPRPDPFAAYWSLIPASRAGALAWAPPIFPSSNPFGFQNIPAPPPPFSLNSRALLPPAGPTQFDDVPPAAANGLFGNTIGRMLAARAKPYDPFEAAANGMWGGIAKMIAANAAPDPGTRGFLGSLADLPVPPNAQAASYAPYSGPFLLSDPIGLPQSSALPDIELIADKTKGPRNLDLFDERAFGETPPLGSAAPRLAPPLGSGPRPPAPPPLAPPASALQPPLRSPLPLESSLSSGALPPPSPGQATNNPRASGTPIAPASTVPSAPSPLVLPTNGSGPTQGASSQPISSPPGAGPSDSSADSPATSSDPKADLLQELFRRVGPGPYAPPNGGVPLSRPYGRGTTAEREQNDANGAEYGCHTCGTKDFGTSDGKPILDHQPSKSLNSPPGAPAQGYPHCVTCSRRQGGVASWILRLKSQ
jgi:hypothetical protein